MILGGLKARMGVCSSWLFPRVDSEASRRMPRYSISNDNLQYSHFHMADPPGLPTNYRCPGVTLRYTRGHRNALTYRKDIQTLRRAPQRSLNI